MEGVRRKQVLKDKKGQQILFYSILIRTSWRYFIQTSRAKAYQPGVQLNIVKHVGGKIKVLFFLK